MNETVVMIKPVLFISSKIGLFKIKSFSGFITAIAIVATTLSVAIMIIGSSITRGYQQIISQKFYNCWGNIHITSFQTNPSSMLSAQQFQFDSLLYRQLLQIQNVKQVYPYNTLAGIMHTSNGMEGIILKGYFSPDAFNNFKQYLVKGNYKADNDSEKYVYLSAYTASLLQHRIGDKIIVYFFNNELLQPKARKFILAGIYQTGIEEYDKMFGLCNGQIINRITEQPQLSVQGYEIYVSNQSEKVKIKDYIFKQLIEAPLEVYTLEERFASVFSWLGMMQMNEKIILIIMAIIAIVNMISVLLILILERTPMIGNLITMGMRMWDIQKIFIINSAIIALIGIIGGFFMGIGLCLFQQYTGFFTLDETVYYTRQVPIYFQWEMIFGILLGTFLTCMLTLLIPSIIIKRINPIHAIQIK